MTAPVARHATEHDHGMLDGYIDFCRRLQVSDRALRDRLRAARTLLADYPDLQRWMGRPVQSRMSDLRRSSAWPLVGWAILSGRVAADLDLLLVKDFGTLGTTAELLFDADFADAHTAAGRLGWSPTWARSIVREALVLTIAATGRTMRQLTAHDLEQLRDRMDASPLITDAARKRHKAQLFGLAQLLFEADVIDSPPRRHYPAAATIEQRFADALPDTAIRTAMTRYVTARKTVLSTSSVDGLVNDLIPFGVFLAEHHPDVVALRQLDRSHIEGFLTFNRTRSWRGRKARGQQVSVTVVHAAVLSLRNFLDDITLWGWADRPPRQLVFATDVPRLPRPLPRALSPDDDAALIAAINNLDDPFARCGLLVLRYAGLRLGELLDLELDAVVDYGAAGSWLRVPLGKLKTERSVPLDETTLAALDAWTTVRGRQRALPNPTTGKPTDFLFVEQGHRIGPWRIRSCLESAAEQAGLLVPPGSPGRITPHRLRHTYATMLANAGMSLQALMVLLGHVTPEMTLRYATLASPTLRASYDEAMIKARRRLPLVTAGRATPPSKVEWLQSEFLKTRVAHGYCSRHLAAEACPYANICEQCDNFVPAPENTEVLAGQLADVRVLHADATSRGWDSEVARHGRVVDKLESHLATLQPPRANRDTRS
jgi:site-specific recombinase XerD